MKFLKTITKWAGSALSLFLLTTYHFTLYTFVYAGTSDSVSLSCRIDVPPGNITNLSALTGKNIESVDIKWTIPGADDDKGNIEKGVYHIKYTKNSSDNWNTATNSLIISTSNIIKGETQEFTVDGLTDNVTYYFWVKTGEVLKDGGTSWALLPSNTGYAVPRIDNTPPAAISDLTALAGNYEGEINLQWTSPGDDGTVGNLTGQFIIKYAQQIITKNNFDLIGTTITINANEVVPGTQQTLGPLQLSESVTYWFAIKAKDDTGLLSVWNSTADVASVNTKAFCQSAIDTAAPAPVTLSFGNVGFTSVELKWNSPTENAGRTQSSQDDLSPGYYDIRFSSLGAIPTDVAWNVPISNRRFISTSTVIGAGQSYTITGLADKTTWWFCLVSIDDAGLSSPYSNSPFTLTSDQTPPSTVSNFAAVPLFAPNGREIQLTWTNPTDADYQGTLIVYSTGTPPAFSPVAGTNYSVGGYIIYKGTAQIYLHSQLTPFAEYFYTAYAYDLRPNYSVPASTTAIAPPAADKVPPREPRGLKIAMSSDKNYLTLSWTQVTKSTDGTTATDLAYYTLHRSIAIGGAETTWTLPVTVTSTTTYTGGLTYYYWLTCHDLSTNVSEPSARVDSPDMNISFYESADPKTSISVPPAISSILYKETNSFGDNIYFDVVRLTSEETGKTYRSFAFLPKKADSEEVVTGLLFSRALADVKISYNVSGGIVGAPGLAPIPANQAADNLSLFWFNGVEWVKVGGDVDTAQQTVSLKTKKGGKYQLRQSMRSGRFALTKVYPRIFTPNGDGWNDVANFIYEGNNAGLTGKIFDINGAFVSDMVIGDFGDNTSLKWDGRNGDGKVVSSGIYIYQIEADKKVFNGTVVVAK